MTGLGSRIAVLRKQKGLTQAAFAKEMGVSNSSANEWEQDVSRPSIDRLTRLAEVLGTSVDALLRPEPQPSEGGRVA